MDNVIDMAELRLRFRRPSHRPDGCQHLNMVFDPNGEIIQCEDCGLQLSAFWVVTRLAEFWDRQTRQLQAKERRLAEAENVVLHLKGAKEVERIWRGRDAVSCPHCHRGILPSDPLGRLSRKFEERRRQAEVKP